MSTFNVVKSGGPSTPEFEGNKFAAETLSGLYHEYNPDGLLDPTELFVKWIITLIGSAGVTVTYGDSGHAVSTSGGKVFATINGQLVRLHLKADNDDFALKKVLMITPASQPDIDQPYLQHAVRLIKDEPDLLRAQAFLLGTILLKRCR